ncbi:MAG: FxsA family protein [Porticoccaceae bacterium]|nr:FxsA family protein [Porticoccaceae bacterium]
MRYLFLIFVITPVIEMWLLITVGSYLGALPTIGLVLLTAFIGVNLLRAQGFETLWRGRRKFEEGQLPAQEIAEGIILAVCGALLLTPGFVTDLIGFSGLIPPIRRIIAQFILSRMVVASVSTSGRGGSFNATNSSGPKRNRDLDDAIEGESWDD